jgi:hypothetical protein
MGISDFSFKNSVYGSFNLRLLDIAFIKYDSLFKDLLQQETEILRECVLDRVRAGGTAHNLHPSERLRLETENTVCGLLEDYRAQ